MSKMLFEKIKNYGGGEDELLLLGYRDTHSAIKHPIFCLL
jgi:hypothetical protein